MALTKPVNVIMALTLTEAYRAKDVLIEDAVGFSPARARRGVISPLLIASGPHFLSAVANCRTQVCRSQT